MLLCILEIFVTLYWLFGEVSDFRAYFITWDYRLLQSAWNIKHWIKHPFLSLYPHQSWPISFYDSLSTHVVTHTPNQTWRRKDVELSRERRKTDLLALVRMWRGSALPQGCLCRCHSGVLQQDRRHPDRLCLVPPKHCGL